MANFPTSPSVGEQFSTSKVTYRWNGAAWDVLEGVKQGIIATHPSSNTKLLLHGETLTDSSASAHTVNANGDTAVSSVQTKFGTSSYIFDGSGDSLSIPDSSDFNFGSDDFTLEMWIHWTAFSGHSSFMSCPKGGSEEQGMYWYLHNDGTGSDAMYFRWRNTAGTRVGYMWNEASLGFVVDTWYHIAVVRNGETLKLYVNGVEQVPDTTEAAIGSTTLNDCDGSWFIGGHWNSSMGSTGHIDEVRISNTARYTANFTPESAAFANPVILPIGSIEFVEGAEPSAVQGSSIIYATSSGMFVKDSVGTVTALTANASLNNADQIELTSVTATPTGTAGTGQLLHWDRSGEDDPYTKLLIHADGAFTGDSSVTPHTVTVNGPLLADAQSKFGGKSFIFDGNNDDLTIANHADFEMGAGDFTVECWYKTSAGGGQWANPIIAYGTNTAAGSSWKIYGGEYLWGYIWSGSTDYNVTATTATNDDQWHHVALCRNGDTMKIFIDGTEEDSVSVTGITCNDAAAATLYVGTDGAGTRYTGYIDEIRISKGVARYTANFTPPTAPFTTGYVAGSGLYYVAPDGTTTLIKGDS